MSGSSPVGVTGWLRLWFTFESRVGRREYALSGIGLAILKYAGDVAIVYAMSRQFWLPIDYLRPLHVVFSSQTDVTANVLPVLAAWSLPFLWIGVSMSMRRSLDAGYSAWLSLLFFVPVVSYVFMLVMSVLPTRPATNAEVEEPRPLERQLPSALLAIGAGAAVGIGMLGLSVYALGSYGPSLFLGTPFVIGALTAFLFNRRYPASGRETQTIVAFTLVCVGGIILSTAAEGALCLFMALPLALLIGAMGSALGRQIALKDTTRASHALLALVVLPATTALEAREPATHLREVRSSVVIEAPATVVWRNVIAFPPLPEPSDLVFRAGIAYPRRARIVGEGVGAVRYCVFSTGAFVEPITRWEPGHRLSFDVASQPRPMHEWSPYADITPPHLDGYFRSRRGEFRLVSLADGRTRLEGSTWYEMRIFPEAYWVLFGDALIGRIHSRVLTHIRMLAERDAAWAPADAQNARGFRRGAR